jgi:hypothetical protein
MPLQTARKPIPPASAPRWARKANTRGFIDVPFDGFLSPSSDIQYLTRILRHHIYYTIKFLFCQLQIFVKTKYIVPSIL